jgi:hypothetical protein
MTHVNWTPELLGRFIKAIEAAKAANQALFTFPVDTRHGQVNLEFSLDYAQYLADHLTDVAAPPTLQ